MSTLRAATSGIPQGLVQELLLFNVFVGNLNSGIKGTFRKFADDTKMSGEVDTKEGRDAILWYLAVWRGGTMPIS